jgi:hypothetical protein
MSGAPGQADLFGFPADPSSRYPDFPGSRPGSDETSAHAALRIASHADTLRELVLEAYQRAYPAGWTADECASHLGRSPLAIRPRVAELKAAGFLIPTPHRRTNTTGMFARVMVWRRPGDGQ